MTMINEKVIKYSVSILVPVVLALSGWMIGIDRQVTINTAKAGEVEKIKEDVQEIDKKVTAILCAVAPEKCLDQ